jgi:hypothetical protein
MHPIEAHYDRTRPMINPSGLVAPRPAADWDESARRGGFGVAVARGALAPALLPRGRAATRT